MRISFFILITLLLANSTTNGQNQNSINRMIAMVKSVPSKYVTVFADKRDANKFDQKEDVWYGVIKHYDTLAIKFLINLITDTTNTKIQNACTKEKYKIGDLAVLLINDIEQMPYATVTRSQWCLWSMCGILPEGFISYINLDRQKFKIAYEEYYHSKMRRSFIKSKRHV